MHATSGQILPRTYVDRARANHGVLSNRRCNVKCIVERVIFCFAIGYGAGALASLVCLSEAAGGITLLGYNVGYNCDITNDDDQMFGGRFNRKFLEISSLAFGTGLTVYLLCKVESENPITALLQKIPCGRPLEIRNGTALPLHDSTTLPLIARTHIEAQRIRVEPRTFGRATADLLLKIEDIIERVLVSIPKTAVYSALSTVILVTGAIGVETIAGFGEIEPDCSETETEIDPNKFVDEYIKVGIIVSTVTLVFQANKKQPHPISNFISRQWRRFWG
ncbi:MAG: hypothetical protein P0S95_03355 [Rhabdochlamydiaceae bacterium]|nr:hypothetical protein [Candidatus Amphrikana amoebophyrae]